MSQQESSLKSAGLATEGVVPDVGAAIQATLDLLSAHARLDFANAHGKWQIGDVTLWDRSGLWFDDTHTIQGQKIATKAALVKINSAYWLLPCALTASGVTLVPYALNFYTDPPNGHAAGDDTPPLYLYCYATCTMPATFTWQIMLSGTSTWENVVVGADHYDRPNCQFGWTETKLTDVSSGDNTGGTLANPLTTTQISPPHTGNRQVLAYAKITVGPKDLEWSDHPGKIRCRIDNTAAGGGVKYTQEISLWFEDFTSC